MSPSKNAGTAPAPFILILDTVYSVEGMKTRLPLSVVKAYPVLLKKRASAAAWVIETVKAVKAAGVEGESIKRNDFSLMELDGFTEKVLCFKMSLQVLKSSEQELEDGFRFKSRLEASRVIGSMADRFANSLAASMGAAMAEGFEKQISRLEASAVMDALEPLVERFAEARDMGSVCKPVTVKAKPKAL